ncbi:MAG: diguanylate cyclase [Gemmatimonas sp.]|nr:diguanylate cyclase [Gemmatimonas sp.]
MSGDLALFSRPIEFQIVVAKGLTQATAGSSPIEPHRQPWWSAIQSLLRLARSALDVDVLSLALPDGEGDALLVSTVDGVRAARASISLGAVSSGANRLTNGAGVLQAAEAAGTFGFVPSGYLGAPFPSRSRMSRGGVAAWTRNERSWTRLESRMLTEVASLAVVHLGLDKRSRREKAPRQSARRYRMFFEGCSDATVLHDITDRKLVEDELRVAELHDPLTGLANRPLFLDRLEQALTRMRRWPTNGFAVVFLDLDGFKSVNDSFGHHQGDRLLIAVSRRLDGCVRGVDTVARFGGDEFAILFDEVPSAHVARRLVERIVETLSDPYALAGQDVPVRASVGLTLGSGRYESPSDVLRDADAAMYRARRNPTATYEIFDDAMRRELADQLKLETKLSSTLTNNELRLLF